MGSVPAPDRVRTESKPQTPGGCLENSLMLEALVVKNVVS